MAEMVTVYHPELEETKEVPANAVPVLKKSGWITDPSEADVQDPEEEGGELDV
jgi:hypothetical protein